MFLLVDVVLWEENGRQGGLILNITFVSIWLYVKFKLIIKAKYRTINGDTRPKVSLTCESMLELATAIRIRVIHCMHTIFALCLRLKSYHFPLFSTSLFSFPINFIPMVFYVTPQVEIWSPLLHSQQYKAFRNIITTSELLEKEKWQTLKYAIHMEKDAIWKSCRKGRRK